jgi:leader peptidase (prepilin peptidase)/N-methyltransferase
MTQSWLVFLPGRKCPHCGKNKGLRFWLITFIIPILFLIPIKGSTPIFSYGISVILIPYFSLVTVIDLEHKTITNQTILFGVIAGFATGVYQKGIFDTITGGLFGFLFFYALFLFGKFLFQKVQSNKLAHAGDDPLGFGDVKLAGIVGLILGWPEIVTGLIGAIIIGGTASIFYILYRLTKGRYLPFVDYLPYGPYIIAGMLFALIT